MAQSDRAIGYLELNSQQWDDALAAAGKALVAFGAVLASYKVADFFKEGIQAAIEFGNEAYFASQKLNGFDPGNLLIIQKALQGAGESAEQARHDIEEFGQANRPLEQLFKGGSSGYTDSLQRAAKEYGTQAAILTESSEKFAYVQQQITNVGTKLQGFFLGLADKVLAPLSTLISQIDKIDLVSMGEQFGAYVTNAIDVILGLVKNGNVFSVLGLALKVGFEDAANYLSGALTSAISVLLKGNVWSGIAEAAVGSLAVIGTFLTNLFLGVGKILVASVEAAFETIRQRYGPFLAFAITGGAAVLANIPHFSTDVGQNLKSIEQGSLIQSQEQASGEILQQALATAAAGIKKISETKIDFKVGSAYDTSKDTKALTDAIAAAQKAGAPLITQPGKEQPIFTERADAVHVIADSLARVGGGGRYVRTGLSIAEKAAMDSAKYNKIQADALQKYLPVIAKQKPGATVGQG